MTNTYMSDHETIKKNRDQDSIPVLNPFHYFIPVSHWVAEYQYRVRQASPAETVSVNYRRNPGKTDTVAGRAF